MQQDRGGGHATIITCVTPPYITFIVTNLVDPSLHAFNWELGSEYVTSREEEKDG